MYSRALDADSSNWRSMLNKGFSELAQGHSEDGAACLKKAFRMTGAAPRPLIHGPGRRA